MQILLRHFITALGGVLLVDTSNTQSFVFGLVAIGCAWLWSVIQKLDWNGHVQIRDDYKLLLQKMGAALVSQGIAALSGWMLESGFAGDVNDPAAVVLFLSNYGASRMGWHGKALGVPTVKLLVLGSLFSVLSSCSTEDMKREGILFGKRVALSGGDIAVAMARAELDKKIDEWIKAEESGDVFKILLAAAAKENAQAALDAAQRALNKQRAKIDAKQPVNVQPLTMRDSPQIQGSPQILSKPQSVGLPESVGDRIPVYAPQVVASLSAR